MITAGGGQDCIDMIQAYVPDLILLDVMMEPMDGWQTLMNLKRNPDSCRIPVIMVSGKTPTPDDVHMYGKYYEHFVMKPVSFPVLFDVVSRVLSPPVIRYSVIRRDYSVIQQFRQRYSLRINGNK